MNILVDNKVEFDRKQRRRISRRFGTKDINVKTIPTNSKVEKRHKSGKKKK
jgi:hypothetical protein